MTLPRPRTPQVVNTWEEAEDTIARMREVIGEPSERSLPLLFRGQASSDWKLSSTLDRTGTSRKGLGDYHRLIATRLRPTLAVYTNSAWKTVPDYKSIHTSLKDGDLLTLKKYPDPETYRFMIYLRHHGFPSPIIDWSRSAYIAAFFAFREQAGGSFRSIWMYHEGTGVRDTSLSEPNINRLGQYIEAHPRHIQQMADYTICTRMDEEHVYVEHEEAFSTERSGSQDFLTRVDIPSTERHKVMKKLDEHNLNAYSLFGTPESLMETLALREF